MYLTLLAVSLTVCLGSAQDVVDTCGCDLIGSMDTVCAADRQCICKPGVTGLQCDQCLPGYTDLGDNGCRLECQCHPDGSLSSECDENSVCQCRLGIHGDKCDTCQDGFHRIDLGCLPCPSCFNEVALQFNITLGLYTALLQRLNDTLSTNATEGSGLNPDLSEEVARYQSLLTDLLQRAVNATKREDALSVGLVDFQSRLTALRGHVDSAETNVTIAVATIDTLTLQANNTRSLLEELFDLVSSLETQVAMEIRIQLEDLIALNQQLREQFEDLVQLATEADEVSLRQESLAADLLQQATVALSNATTALQLLRDALSIQNQTRQLVDMIQTEALVRLESLYSQGVSALTDAQTSVPIALEDSLRVLESVRNISIPEYSLESRQDRLAQLRNSTASLRNLITQLDTSLNVLLANFTEYNETATRLLSESEDLNREATELLALAEEAFSSANDSVTNGNQVIQEARRLLTEVQARLSDGRDFTAGLEEVLRNIELAETLSLEAERETAERGRELVDAIATANRAAALLEGATMSLSRAFEVATGANQTANQVLSEAAALSDAASEFADEASQAETEVDRLEEAVNEDTDAIAMVSDTANETISAAANLTSRLMAIRRILVNLTAEFDSISLIPLERLEAINSTLSSLERDSAANQMLVDSLTDQVRQLQESADDLRTRYTQVQQHRDLLQDILRNVEELNCREQFES